MANKLSNPNNPSDRSAWSSSMNAASLDSTPAPTAIALPIVKTPAENLPLWRAFLHSALVTAAGLVAAALIATGLTGCADMSGISSTAILRNAPSLGLPTSAAATPASAAPEPGPRWWRDFGDVQLSTLVESALQNNPTLALAQARLARAQAVTEVANAITRPQLNGQLDITRQRYTANGAVPPPLAGSVRDTGLLQFSSSWEIDFFGKNRAALDAALGTVKAAAADSDAARLLLSANVARTYFQLVRLQAQKQVALRTLAQRSQALALVQDRLKAGLDTQLELRQSEGSLPEARLQIEQIDEQMQIAGNTLQALVGQPNQPLALDLPAQAAIKTIAVDAAINADLLGRRPDIAAARWRVEASSQEVANAKAQFYPNINLVAYVGLSSIGLGRLLDIGSQQWGVGPALRLPIFDAGRLRANLRGKSADLDAAIESYNAAVIDALHDAADQLAMRQAVARQQTEQAAAQASAEGAYAIALQRYRAGLGTYLNVLAAETGVLAQRRIGVDLAGRAVDAHIGLIRALGGGYQAVAVPESAPEMIAVRAGVY